FGEQAHDWLPLRLHLAILSLEGRDSKHPKVRPRAPVSRSARVRSPSTHGTVRHPPQERTGPVALVPAQRLPRRGVGTTRSSDWRIEPGPKGLLTQRACKAAT